MFSYSSSFKGLLNPINKKLGFRVEKREKMKI